jgi:hypothetical protein
MRYLIAALFCVFWMTAFTQPRFSEDGLPAFAVGGIGYTGQADHFRIETDFRFDYLNNFTWTSKFALTHPAEFAGFGAGMWALYPIGGEWNFSRGTWSWFSSVGWVMVENKYFSIGGTVNLYYDGFSFTPQAFIRVHLLDMPKRENKPIEGS